MKFKSEIKSLVFVHMVMLVGEMMFAIIIYVIALQFNSVNNNLNLFKTLQIIAVVTSLAGVFTAFKIVRQKIQQIQLSNKSFQEKFIEYRSACVLKYTLLEAPALFCLVGYFLTQNISFLLLFGILFMVLAGQKPTVVIMMHELNVSREDLMQE